MKVLDASVLVEYSDRRRTHAEVAEERLEPRTRALGARIWSTPRSATRCGAGSARGKISAEAAGRALWKSMICRWSGSRTTS